MEYKRENQIVQKLAKNLLHQANKSFNSVLRVEEKTSPTDVVAEIDFTADKLIMRTLQKYFKNDTIVTEESSAELFKEALKGKRSWIVDPICGSFNALRKIKISATNI